jgi:enamine deaminase RidA (YjgF/YER057c/UK114 family)
MPYKYFVFLPVAEGSVEKEWEQCLNQVIDTHNSGYSPVKLNIFTDLPDFKTMVSVRQTILKSVISAFGTLCPAVNITVQPPEKPWKTAVEASFIVTGSANIAGRSFNSIPYIILESETGKEVWSGGVSSYSYPSDTRIAAEKAFDIMAGILKKEQMSMNDIVRQWNYVGDILAVRGGYQNYQIFNEVRSDYYHRYRNIKGFPAATGVGIKHGGVILDFCAVKPRQSVMIKPVENPSQINAYSYGQQVLMGLADEGRRVNHPPQFERGLLLANNKYSILFISGTASILGQETVGMGDIEKQTLITIENIRKVSDNAGINKLVSEQSVYRENFSLLRIYIKRQSDFSTVRQVCDKYFKGIPAVYIEADICRDDLLIEIEAEALFER